METEKLTIQLPDAIAEAEKASYDIQIATAKRYPRNVKKAINNMIAIVTMDKETAETCGFSKPTAGKMLTGPSVHLAKILAQNWGNIRVESKVTKITTTHIYAEAICFDLESNVAIKTEASRKIIKKDGKRYSEDVINTNGLAIAAIAKRNAIFDVIPKSIVNKVYQESLNMITGDLSDETKLIAKRKKVIDGFKDTYSVSLDEILKKLGLNSENQIKQEEIKQLIGLAQTLKDNEMSVDEMFDRIPEDQKKEMLTNPQVKTFRDEK